MSWKILKNNHKESLRMKRAFLVKSAYLQFSCHDIVFRCDSGIDSNASWADGNTVDALALAASQLILQLSL